MAQVRIQWRAVVNMVLKLGSSIKGEEFLDKLTDYQFLKKGFAPWC
jgi:hypothetical protein